MLYVVSDVFFMLYIISELFSAIHVVLSMSPCVNQILSTYSVRMLYGGTAKSQRRFACTSLCSWRAWLQGTTICPFPPLLKLEDNYPISG